MFGGWRSTRKRNNEELLALQSLGEGKFIFIVDACYPDAFWESRLAGGTSEGCDGVFACFEKCLKKMSTNTTPSLLILKDDNPEK